MAERCANSSPEPSEDARDKAKDRQIVALLEQISNMTVAYDELEDKLKLMTAERDGAIAQAKRDGADWQPIESAPKDGTRILVAHPAYEGMGPDGPCPMPAAAHVAYWNPEGSSWVDECGSFDGDVDHLETTGNWNSGTGWFQPNEVTHWMPLPQPPAAIRKPESEGE